jgi:Biopolymer transport protein
VLAFQSPTTLLAVKLPFAKEGEKGQITQVLRVQVLRNGEYLYEGKRATLEELAKTFEEKKPKRLIIEADKDTAHKFVVSLMDMAKAKRVEEVLIATRRRP